MNYHRNWVISIHCILCPEERNELEMPEWMLVPFYYCYLYLATQAGVRAELSGTTQNVPGVVVVNNYDQL
jgi:hypothetical protein